MLIKLTAAHREQYFNNMKVKTSITLSSEVLRLIDRRQAEFKSRSEFLERAAREMLAQLSRTEADRRDLELINRHADKLNAEAKDVLEYQAPL
jgi:metal-responsive CopG/Arc/MetJ family transcriptional regulator